MAFVRKRGNSHQLIKSYRDGDKVRQRVLANLGPHPTVVEAIASDPKRYAYLADTTSSVSLTIDRLFEQHASHEGKGRCIDDFLSSLRALQKGFKILALREEPIFAMAEHLPRLWGDGWTEFERKFALRWVLDRKPTLDNWLWTGEAYLEWLIEFTLQARGGWEDLNDVMKDRAFEIAMAEIEEEIKR